ncbi:16S rRNA (uracil(1498)-N(3))-methyltransferase [Campylobacter sp. faydin G-105]|uniref:16S rRNA (uracil(1498)-N(3))-methyltransferase n=1 Tax=Campylobacter anatolicus TaxID=2829105 RepID=UPI001B98CAEA|nr:16S rRNA (uracil(1498)-N(3))-methyltransferase [Campylobacter anatolicus]MBR8462340.1 16S rRNA (uracil(1498)-N(3))-methyltransferase [Campylobacter anatolicus]
MQFLYDKDAGCERLELVNEPFLHLKARRIKVGERLSVRNLKDGKNYLYEILSFMRRSAELELVFTSSVAEQKRGMSLAWAVVEPKTIEKTLPFLNELGVSKLIFVYTKFSQANFKLDLARFEYICALSCEQCGRGTLMEFEIYSNIDDFLGVYENVAIINFGGKSLQNYNNELLFIGCEGGFSDDEVAKFKNSYALGASNILRSQTAMIGVASRLSL